MNITLLKSSRKFPAIHYSEKKIKQSEKAGLTGKDAKVELVDIRNFPIADAASLSAAAKEQVMIDYCSKSLAKLLQLHFAVSCRRHENTEEELRAAAVELLDKMGLSHSPAIFYIHRDTENLHLHVVSTKCDENGRRIKDWRSIKRMRDILDKFEGRNVEKDARRAVELASSYHFRDQLRIIIMNHRDKVTSVVNNDIRSRLNHPTNSTFIFLRGGSVNGENIQSFVDQGCRDIILCGKGITAGDEHLGSTVGENLAKTSGLGLKMDRKSHLQPGERLGVKEFLIKTPQQRHVVPYPVDFKLPALPLSGVPYLTFDHDFFILEVQI